MRDACVVRAICAMVLAIAPPGCSDDVVGLVDGPRVDRATDGSRIEAGKPDSGKPDLGTLDVAKLDLAKPDLANPDLKPKPDLGQPTSQWVTLAGGTSGDLATAVAIDSQKNLYITGHYSGTATFGAHTSPPSTGGWDIFVAKVSPAGSFLWVTGAGSTADDEGRGIGVDNAGNVYVTGIVKGTSSTFGTSTIYGAGLFVARLDSTGKFVWAKRACAAAGDTGYGLATDGTNAYLTGQCSEFLAAKVDPSGTFSWKTLGTATGNAISTDAQGNSTVVGGFTGAVTFGATQLTSVGSSQDAFVTRLSPTGSFVWTVPGGGSGVDAATGVASGATGQATVVGTITGTASFGTVTVPDTGAAGFVARVDSAGKFLWVKSAGGSGAGTFLRPAAVALGPTGSAFVTGGFHNTVTLGATTISSNLYTNLFLSEVSDTGQFLWTVAPKAKETLQGYGVAADSAGSAYVTGYLYVGATFGTVAVTPVSYSQDAFVWKYGY